MECYNHIHVPSTLVNVYNVSTKLLFVVVDEFTFIITFCFIIFVYVLIQITMALNSGYVKVFQNVQNLKNPCSWS